MQEKQKRLEQIAAKIAQVAAANKQRVVEQAAAAEAAAYSAAEDAKKLAVKKRKVRPWNLLTQHLSQHQCTPFATQRCAVPNHLPTWSSTCCSLARSFIC